MIAVPIGPRHRFAVVGSPGYFKYQRPPVTPHDLKGMPCIRYRFAGGGLYRWEFERGGIEVDIEVDGPLTLNDQDLMVDAALDGSRSRLRVRDTGGRTDREAQTGAGTG